MPSSATNTTRHFWIILAIIPGLLACTLVANVVGTPDSGSDPDDQPQVAQPADRVTPSASSSDNSITIVTLEGGEQEIPTPRPDTFSQLLEDNVERGVWQLGEGFVLLLSYLTGERGADEIPAFQPVEEPSPTVLLWLAIDYLEIAPADDEYADEIARLLAELTPDQAALDRLTGAGETTSHNHVYNAGHRLQEGVPAECAVVTGAGFSAVLDTGEFCYLSESVDTISGTMAVYYPKWWQDEPGLMAVVDLTLEALLDSEQVYAGFGEFGDVNVAFSLSQPSSMTDILAYQLPINGDDPCPVTVLPLFSSLVPDTYLQTIAHEVFHCFQDWNLNKQPYRIHRWWAEGSAEYFSNLVYPITNYEHRFLGSYYLRSPVRPVFDLTYHNFIFFQFLANQLGDAELLNLMETLSISGTMARQTATLASYPNMDQLFQEFIVATMSDGVIDSGGGKIVLQDFPVISKLDVRAEGQQDFGVDPFVAGRFALRYQQERLFLQQPLEDGFALHSTALATARRDRDSWRELPAEVRSGCQSDEIHAVAVTSVREPGLFTADVTVVEEASCDPCVLGTWDMQTESFEALLEQAVREGAIADLPPGGIDLEVEPHLYYQFDEHGEITGLREDFTIVIISSEDPPVRTIINSQGHGTYSADGETMEVQNMVFQIDSVQVLADGVDVSAFMTTDVSTFNFFGESGIGPGLGESRELDGSIVRYVCTEERLEMTAPESPPVIFDRVDIVLPTPMPTLSP